LEKNPGLLGGCERKVSVLFADLRGFTRLAQRLGAVVACRLVADVMEHLTARVQEFDGVVIDYTCDGLMAIWNAPADQPKHAVKACPSGLAIRADIAAFDTAWRPRLGEQFRLGLDRSTGKALCGNIGRRLKLKYSALGHTVNLANRVEGATKHLGVPLPITGSTWDHSGK
jgi:adenylate cyclase